jgi:hypothetical protein
MSPTDLGRYEVLRAYRRATDSVYTLSFDLSDPAVVRFVEYLEYLRTPGDPGREIAHTLVVPADRLAAFAICLDRVARSAAGGRPSPPDGIPIDDTPVEPWAAALVDAGRALAASGQLRDDPALGGSADRVAGWLTAAGIPYERTSWSWENSE